ncbi:DUF2155 domain-containing protein [Limibaculum sp. FT325]|uniref:DUF2155 domain-containing protein n=1 Tax=Thermohalobaculum sediminis TaxID=2939436 RepID=UPI0020C1061D|nr:DUF2155 domain-containing protein [Limibaculum sediminis]MCL5778724.1 DUF2155 domain-containing protein [Limibaculum sediminis]
MRCTRLIATVLAAALAGLPGLALAQTGGAIEESPLEPLRPRLPGGTVVTPETRNPLPGGITVVPGEPAGGADTTAPGTEAAAPGQAGLGLPAGDGAETPADADPLPGGAAAGAATATLPPESEEQPGADLFKRAPPGTGSVLGAQAPELIEPVAREDAPGAVLRQLDKLTGRIDTFDLKAGEEATVSRLRVALTECRLPEDGTSGNHIAFLRIWDTKRPDAPPVFAGWMFADSPALSAMDHPRYDLWVIRCITASGSESAVNR